MTELDLIHAIHTPLLHANTLGLLGLHSAQPLAIITPMSVCLAAVGGLAGHWEQRNNNRSRSFQACVIGALLAALSLPVLSSATNPVMWPAVLIGAALHLGASMGALLTHHLQPLPVRRKAPRHK